MKELRFAKNEKIKAIAWLDSLINSLKDGKRYEINVKEIKAKRSLSANAYAWVLMHKLSDKLQKDVDSIYREYIKDVGGNVEVVRLEDRCIDMMCELFVTGDRTVSTLIVAVLAAAIGKDENRFKTATERMEDCPHLITAVNNEILVLARNKKFRKAMKFED